MTVAGVPSVYAGDEFGWAGVKEERLGGDDAVRQEFPLHPPAPGSLTPQEESVLRAHRDLVAVRRRAPWLHRARTDVVHRSNRQLVLRAGRDTDAVVVALNLDDHPVELPAAGATTVVCGTGDLAGKTVRLPARGWAVLEGVS